MDGLQPVLDLIDRQRGACAAQVAFSSLHCCDSHWPPGRNDTLNLIWRWSSGGIYVGAATCFCACQCLSFDLPQSVCRHCLPSLVCGTCQQEPQAARGCGACCFNSERALRPAFEASCSAQACGRRSCLPPRGRTCQNVRRVWHVLRMNQLRFGQVVGLAGHFIRGYV